MLPPSQWRIVRGGGHISPWDPTFYIFTLYGRWIFTISISLPLPILNPPPENHIYISVASSGLYPAEEGNNQRTIIVHKTYICVCCLKGLKDYILVRINSLG